MPSFTTEHHEVCKGCVLCKYARAPFPESDSRSKGILDLIHIDICGPMSSLSIRGKFKYHITFIDNFSRKTWIYFLTRKTSKELLKKFQEFKALVETRTGKRIRALGSNNGGEYTSYAFKRLCAKVGIKRESTIPYTPQQNGVSERKNRVIVGATKAMLHDQNLPKFLWAKACNTAIYLQNRSPHKVLENVTPKEAFTERKPDIIHLRIFGCVEIWVPWKVVPMCL
jgi:transposase InsO family protein